MISKNAFIHSTDIHSVPTIEKACSIPRRSMKIKSVPLSPKKLNLEETLKKKLLICLERLSGQGAWDLKEKQN